MAAQETTTHPPDDHGATRTEVSYYGADWRPHDHQGSTYFTEARYGPDGLLVWTAEGITAGRDSTDDD